MIASYIEEMLGNPASGVIRRMFEEGARMKAELGEENVFDFSLGNPSLEPPLEVEKALQEAVQDTSAGRHGYMPNAGYMTARQAMAEKTAREQGVKVRAENVVMSVGAAGALNTVLKALLNPGDEVVVPCPYFTEYDHYIQNHGGVIKRVKTRDDFSLDAQKVGEALTGRTAAVIINSPNNPTGRVYSEEDIKALSQVLEAHGKRTGRLPYLVCDEPYRDIVYNRRNGEKAAVSPVFPYYKNAVIVTSFAKGLSLPGERIGYIAVNDACDEADKFIAAAIFATRILGFVNAPALWQKTVAASWDAPNDCAAQYQKRRDLMCSVLDEAGLEYAAGEGAFYLFVKVPSIWHGDDMAFVNCLKEHNILCAPGRSFAGAGYFRAAYCVGLDVIERSRKAWREAMAVAPK